MLAGDYTAFAKIQAQLLNAPTPLKNVPLRIYMPTSPSGDDATPGSFRVMQTLVPPRLPNSKFSLAAKVGLS
jgi:autophagy-related protein 5